MTSHSLQRCHCANQNVFVPPFLSFFLSVVSCLAPVIFKEKEECKITYVEDTVERTKGFELIFLLAELLKNRLNQLTNSYRYILEFKRLCLVQTLRCLNRACAGGEREGERERESKPDFHCEKSKNA